MPVSTIDPKAALVVVDLQKGLLGAPTTPLPMNEVVRQAARLARAFRAQGQLGVTQTVVSGVATSVGVEGTARGPTTMATTSSSHSTP
jgi:nicotinamidase-related amidase